MNEEEFKFLYLCSLEKDTRFEALVKRLEQYYKDTLDSMGNKEAYACYREFREWAKFSGYSSKEIKRAKQATRY